MMPFSLPSGYPRGLRSCCASVGSVHCPCAFTVVQLASDPERLCEPKDPYFCRCGHPLIIHALNERMLNERTMPAGTEDNIEAAPALPAGEGAAAAAPASTGFCGAAHATKRQRLAGAPPDLPSILPFQAALPAAAFTGDIASAAAAAAASPPAPATPDTGAKRGRKRVHDEHECACSSWLDVLRTHPLSVQRGSVSRYDVATKRCMERVKGVQKRKPAAQRETLTEARRVYRAAHPEAAAAADAMAAADAAAIGALPLAAAAPGLIPVTSAEGIPAAAASVSSSPVPAGSEPTGPEHADSSNDGEDADLKEGESKEKAAEAAAVSEALSPVASAPD